MRKWLPAFVLVPAIFFFGTGVGGTATVHALPADNGRYAIYQLPTPVGGVLLDTRTGRVWRVAQVTDEKGTETGKIALEPVPFLKALPGDVTQP